MVRDAIRSGDGSVGVADEVKRELVVLGEALVRLDGVARDANEDDAGALEILPRIAKCGGLLRAPRRLVLWVEVEDDVLAPQGSKLHVLAVMGLRREVRRRLSDRDLGRRGR